MQKQQTKTPVIQKQIEIDWKILDVFLNHADENYQQFLEDFEEEEGKWARESLDNE